LFRRAVPIGSRVGNVSNGQLNLFAAAFELAAEGEKWICKQTVHLGGQFPARVPGKVEAGTGNGFESHRNRPA